ncbi:uncharacterized protein LOC133830506 [Humulus lupulus]|uniref:uncharacterized protein LOC133830506 n=1 Tax=Humulus lupulus TaxID=3486 RepID=UPI002B401891|nr:uncharacterized protein LOC133830506 [Humulus lupulus]XP_062116477.1 uncharacterized protein LOC133830506 [Humulus lupulus]
MACGEADEMSIQLDGLIELVGGSNDRRVGGIGMFKDKILWNFKVACFGGSVFYSEMYDIGDAEIKAIFRKVIQEFERELIGGRILTSRLNKARDILMEKVVQFQPRQ